MVLQDLLSGFRAGKPVALRQSIFQVLAVGDFGGGVGCGFGVVGFDFNPTDGDFFIVAGR